jgi:hypothetical protein
MLICDYYGLAKEIKTNKFNKEEIIIFWLNLKVIQIILILYLHLFSFNTPIPPSGVGRK